MRYSIIIVSLNPGEKLIDTVQSALMQTSRDFEVLIKDGGSTDDSLDIVRAMEHPLVRIVQQKDNSIYEGMNQAIKQAKGDYFIFMNAGDVFADSKVLTNVTKHMVNNNTDIIYGNMRRKGQETIIPYPNKLTDFGCFRNVPCHQVCFYSRRLFSRRGYNLKFKVRCDYEHFLWCIYRAGATTSHINYPIAIYEGGGYSETKENLEISRKEHVVITEKYIGKKVRWYRVIMILTLQPVREWIANNKLLSGVYQKIKGLVYGR